MSMQDTKPNIYETTTFLGGTSVNIPILEEAYIRKNSNALLNNQNV